MSVPSNELFAMDGALVPKVHSRLFDWHLALSGTASLATQERGASTGEVIEWYRQAAERGNAESQTILGALYESGQGVAMNLESAFEWYR